VSNRSIGSPATLEIVAFLVVELAFVYPNPESKAIGS
jgi:hypothetical protein